MTNCNYWVPKNNAAYGACQGAICKSSTLKIGQGFVNSMPNAWQFAKSHMEECYFKKTNPTWVGKFGLVWIIRKP